MILRDNTYDGYPPGWSIWDKHARLVQPGAFGFAGTHANINRFGARYRAAISLRQVEFEHLSPSTAQGYTALCRLLLTYSSFEYFLKAIGVKATATAKLMNTQERRLFLTKLRRLDTYNAVCKVLYEQTQRRVKEQLGDYLKGKDCNPFDIAAGMRHVFAHGILTANPQGVRSESLTRIADSLSTMLIKIMEREFKKRVNNFEKSIPR